MNTITIEIDGMHCDGCAEHTKILRAGQPGVREVTVSFADGLAPVRYNPDAVAEERLAEIIERAGFGVRKA